VLKYYVPLKYINAQFIFNALCIIIKNLFPDHNYFYFSLKDESVSPGDKKNWNRNDSQKSSLNGCESPKLGRKQLSATSTEDLIASKSFGENCISNLSLELQTLRQDILREIRKELNLMKLDIIESTYIFIYLLYFMVLILCCYSKNERHCFHES